MVLGLIVWGIYSLGRLSIDAVPDITDNQIQVITTSPSLAAQEVEQFITFPLEMQLGNIPKVENIRSISRFGLSVITVVFEEDMDIYLARQLISERLELAQEEIPREFGKPYMGPLSTGLGEIFQYTLYAKEGFEDKIDAMELRSLQDWVVKRQLMGIEGVIEVNSAGGFLKQYEVAINPDKLKALNLSLTDVYEALAKNNANTGGSYIEKGAQTYFIRGEGFLGDMAEIEEVLVKRVDGLPILIKDLAKVQLGHAPRFGAITMNGMGEAVAGQVMMLKGANAADVTQKVKERLVQISSSLPEGVVIEPFMDRTKLINRTTQTVTTNLIEGGLIVIFVLVLLLGNLRAGLIVASVIPLSMLFAVSMMNVFGVSANLMSLGAIDFGLIVDGAVIIVEAILHHLGLKKIQGSISQEKMDKEVFLAASKIRTSAAFGEIIILIVYLPILFLVGIEGKMFRPMAQTVGFAILGALILSLTYVPMISALFLSKKPIQIAPFSQKIMAFFQRIYTPVLDFAFRFKALFLAATVALFVLSLMTLRNMGGEFIPVLEEGDFALHQILPPGSSIGQGVKVSAELQNILLDKFPEVEKVVTEIGTGEIPTDIMPIETGDIFVILKPKEEWTSASSKEELFERMEEEMNQFPGVIYEFTQPIQMRFNELMTGIRQDIAIKIFGEELGTLAQKGEEAKEIMEQIEGVGDIQVEPTAGLRQMLVRYERAKISKFGLSIEDINRIIRGSFAGEKAGLMFEEEKRFDIVVRLDPEFRQDIQDLRNLYVPLPEGGQIPLSELAQIYLADGPTQISRENAQRRITIGVNARGRDVESLVNEIKEELNEQLDLPDGYYVNFGGQFENLENARARLAVVVPVALALIFFLLFTTFQSLNQSLIIFTAIPMSAIGGIWALYLRGMPFSISAGVGFIALFGVAVLNGIVLLSYFNTLKEQGMADLMERIKAGTQVRLRPVIMTAAVASLGFLPMAVSTAAGAEVQQPLATVVIGGLLSATFLTLIILPILYYYAEKTMKKAKTKATLMGLLLLISAPISNYAQNSISLEEAISISLQNAPNLKRDAFMQEAAEKLSRGSLLNPSMNLFTSGDEVDRNFENGIRSIGFMQSFNLPAANNASKRFHQENTQRAFEQLALSQRSLKQAVRKAFYQCTYTWELDSLQKDWLRYYEEFADIAQIRFEAGESGKIPLLNAETRKQEILLMAEQTLLSKEIARQELQKWLFSDSSYQVDQRRFHRAQSLASPEEQAHPLLNIRKQDIAMAQAQVKVQQSKLLPQIQAGGRWQTINGNSPFWGYQLGINIPLFRKSYRNFVESAKVSVMAKEAELTYQESLLAKSRSILDQKLAKSQQAIRVLEEELLVLAGEQQSLSREAYQNGEINYIQYMQSLDKWMELRMKHLQSLFEWHLLYTDFLYLNEA